MVRQLFFQCFRRCENVFDSDVQYRVRDFKNIYSRVVHELVIPQVRRIGPRALRMVMDLLFIDTAFVLHPPDNRSIDSQQQVIHVPRYLSCTSMLCHQSVK